MIVNKGLNLLRDLVSGNTTIYGKQLQLGSSDTAETISQTDLQGTTLGVIDNIDSTNTDAIGRVTFVKTKGTGDDNDTWKEIAVFSESIENSTLTSDPTDVANSVCTDTSLSLLVDEWVDYRVQLTHSSTDYYYTIVSNTADTFTIDSNAYTDGVRSSDVFDITIMLSRRVITTFTKSSSYIFRLENEYRITNKN